jgi:hypothetical protein
MLKTEQTDRGGLLLQNAKLKATVLQHAFAILSSLALEYG